jgi:hypothetical protein
MKGQGLYYRFKPYLPWGVRMALRRLVARHRRRSSTAVWPVDESAGKPPPGWPGWPEGKQFALVLTHDVEGPDGLPRCRRLAELDKKFGFRSSFNFIPEGSYAVPAELRTWLAEAGFEVGVHDLNHDGFLFRSRSSYVEKAERINGYLRAWNAVGFRAGFMFRNLGWYHDLDIQYDASTFDTDPFEPQSDGAGTIFPFWVPAPATQSPGDSRRAVASGEGGLTPSPSLSPSLRGPRRGYVELPYTLPQDSTLFMLFREKTANIWHQKLDWIVRQGGMALVNVHPDYLHLKSGNNGAGSGRTVEEHYAHWLQYLSETYGKVCWHVLPREMAAFVRESRKQDPLHLPPG